MQEFRHRIRGDNSHALIGRLALLMLPHNVRRYLLKCQDYRLPSNVAGPLQPPKVLLQQSSRHSTPRSVANPSPGPTMLSNLERLTPVKEENEGSIKGAK